jgi:hypothetical protein
MAQRSARRQSKLVAQWSERARLRPNCGPRFGGGAQQRVILTVKVDKVHAP